MLFQLADTMYPSSEKYSNGVLLGLKYKGIWKRTPLRVPREDFHFRSHTSEKLPNPHEE